MVIVTCYTVEYDEAQEVYKIRNLAPPFCPDCAALLSGYDTRARHVIDSSGAVKWFKLRRLRCPGCGKLHIELPDFMQPKKHYEAKLINDTLAKRSNYCPADDSTIRRWRRENYPPGSPVPGDVGEVCLTQTNEKEGKND